MDDGECEEGRPSPTVQELLATDHVPPPDVLRSSSEVDLGHDPIPVERYTDPRFAELETEKVWGEVWQMACRDEDIPDHGDVHVYDGPAGSVILVRQADGAVKAFANACLHRGRRLCDQDGRHVHLRCPFHGFSWHLDGSLRKMTNAWDFEHVDEKSFSLPEFDVARWGGFVFINPSGSPEPFEPFLEGLDTDFETRGWDLGERRKVVYVRKHYPANWKVALEAFIESFHVVATHPSAMAYIGDANAQYDVWPDRRHVTRMIVPRGMHSPHVGPLTDEMVFRAGIAPLHPDGADKVDIPDGLSVRAATAADRRTFLKDNLDIEADIYSDSEMIDTIQYHVFPNLVFWAGMGSFLVYRFLPDGKRPDRCIMDIMFLVPESEKMPRKIVREPTVLGIEDSHHDAPQLGGYCAVFDEDMSNIGAIQAGLESFRGAGTTLGAYQEMRIRRFHKTLGEYIAQ